MKHAAPDFPVVGRHAIPDDPPTDPFLPVVPPLVEDRDPPTDPFLPVVPPGGLPLPTERVIIVPVPAERDRHARRRPRRDGSGRHRTSMSAGQIVARVAVVGALGLIAATPVYLWLNAVPPAAQQVPAVAPIPLVEPLTTTPITTARKATTTKPKPTPTPTPTTTRKRIATTTTTETP